MCRRDGGTGRHKGLKIPRHLKRRAGSIPVPGIARLSKDRKSFFFCIFLSYSFDKTPDKTQGNL